MTFLKKEEGSPCCWAFRGRPWSVWSIGASRGDARGGDRWRGAARSVLAGGDGRTRSRGACSRRCRARGDGSSNERRRGSSTTTSGRRRQRRLGGSCRVAGKGALSDGVSLGWCERPPGDLCCALCRAQQRTSVSARPSLGRPRHPCDGDRAILERRGSA